MIFKRPLLWTFVAASILSPTVQAVPVSYDFSGKITEIIDTNNYTTGLVSTSSTFTGQFTYDTENFTVTFPSAANPFNQIYIDLTGSFSMSMNIDGLLDFDPMTDVAAVVTDNEPGHPSSSGSDWFFFDSNNVSSPAAVPPPAAWDLPLSDTDWWLQFRFQTVDENTLDSVELPTELPVAAFVDQGIRISAGQINSFGWLVGDGYQITGEITSLQLVPVPPAFALFASALSLLAIRRFPARRAAGLRSI